MEQPRRSAARGGVAGGEQQPRRQRHPLQDGERQLRRAGAPVEADEGAAQVRVPQRRALALELRQEQDRPPVAVCALRERQRARDVAAARLGPPLQRLAAALRRAGVDGEAGGFGEGDDAGAPIRSALAMATISLVPLM